MNGKAKMKVSFLILIAAANLFMHVNSTEKRRITCGKRATFFIYFCLSDSLIPSHKLISGINSFLPYSASSPLNDIMAVGCKLRLSANICIFLGIYVSFVYYKSLYLQKSTFLNDSDVYFVSKVSCRTEIAGNLRQQRNPSGDKEFSNSLKAVMLCKLFH